MTAAATAALAIVNRASASAGPGVPSQRLSRLSKGANICRWFRFRDAKRDRAEELSNYVSETEAEMMAQIGLTHVRLCLQPREVMDQSTGAVRDEVAGTVDAAIE